MSSEHIRPGIESIAEWYESKIKHLEGKLEKENEKLKRDVIIYWIASWKLLLEKLKVTE